MRIKLPHAPYIARKITTDLLGSGFVKFKSGTEPITAVAQEILCVDINKERALEERVKELLEQNPQMKTAEVAYELGFEYPNYFSKFFKKQVNLTPKEYRLQLVQINNKTPSWDGVFCYP